MSDEKELQGMAAIVTGSTGNIGRAISLTLAKAGASVTINARTSVNKANQVVKEIQESGGRAIACMGDVTSEKQVQNIIDTTIGEFGRLDILVNNVGPPSSGPVTEISY